MTSLVKTMWMRHYEAPCEPPPWVVGGHGQTLWGHLLPSRAPRISGGRGYAPREIQLDDGERLLAHTSEGRSGVCVYLFHGLSGDADSDYIRRTAAALRARGHGVWAVNHRGCGAGAGLAWRPYHSGSYFDLAAVVRDGRRMAPDLTHVIVGFSLSGNAGLLLAAKEEAGRPDALVSINPPIDLATSSRLIHTGLSRLYERRFLWRLRRAIHRRVRDGKTKHAYHIPFLASLCELDDLFTAPEAGFEDGADYYQRCSSQAHLKHVHIPTVIITAADDPFVHPEAFERVEISNLVHLHLEPHGGHVGYLAQKGLGWQRWLDGAIVHYVNELTGSIG